MVLLYSLSAQPTTAFLTMHEQASSGVWNDHLRLLGGQADATFSVAQQSGDDESISPEIASSEPVTATSCSALEDIALGPDVWMPATSDWQIRDLGTAIVRVPPMWQTRVISSQQIMGQLTVVSQTQTIQVNAEDRASQSLTPSALDTYQDAGYAVSEVSVKGFRAWKIEATPLTSGDLCREVIVTLPDMWVHFQLDASMPNTCQHSDEFDLMIASLQILGGPSSSLDAGMDKSATESDSLQPQAITGMYYNRTAAVNYGTQYCGIQNNSDGCYLWYNGSTLSCDYISGGWGVDGAHFIAHALCAGQFPIHQCAGQGHSDGRVIRISEQRAYIKGFDPVYSTSCSNLQPGDVVYIGKGSCWGWGGVVRRVSGGVPYLMTHSTETCDGRYDTYYSPCGQPADYDCVHINNSPPPVPTLNNISNSDGDGNYTVSWSSSENATRYELQERYESNSWSLIYNGSNRQVNRSNRSPGLWDYRVRACHSGGCGNWSSIKNTTVKPEVPTLDPIDNPDGDGTYIVDWSDETAATSYDLQRQYEGGNWDTIYTGATSQYSESGRGPGEWCYRVRASNAGGDSGWSNIRCTTVKPNAPTLNEIVNDNYAADYTVSWTSSTAADTYTLEEDDNPSFNSPVERCTTSNTQCSVTDQEKGIWYYRVRASNAGGDSGWSNEVSTAVGTFFSLAPTSAVTNTPYALHVYTLTLTNEAPHTDAFQWTHVTTDTSRLPSAIPGGEEGKYEWRVSMSSEMVTVAASLSATVQITVEIPAYEVKWVTHTLTVTATSQTYGTQRQATLHTSTRGRKDNQRWVSCRFDLGGSGRVNPADMTTVSSHLGSILTEDMIYDFNHSGQIDTEDVALLQAQIGTWCDPIIVAPSALDINGPLTGYTHIASPFTATVSPILTTTPLTYAWHAPEYLSRYRYADLWDTTVFTWHTPGTKAVTVTAANSAGSVTGTVNVTVLPLWTATPTHVVTNTPYALQVYTLTLDNQAPQDNVLALTYVATDTSTLPAAQPGEEWKYDWQVQLSEPTLSIATGMSRTVRITVAIPAYEVQGITHTLQLIVSSQTYGNEQVVVLTTSTGGRWNGSRWVNCRFDVDGSARVVKKDADIVYAYLNSTRVGDMIYDFDHSGIITEEDRNLVWNSMGIWCDPN